MYGSHILEILFKLLADKFLCIVAEFIKFSVELIIIFFVLNMHSM